MRERIDTKLSFLCIGRMVGSPPSGARLALAAVLMLLLALTGAGRGFAAVPAVDGLAGITMPICHSGPGEAPVPDDPAHPVQHDCCDTCALLAPALLPTPPIIAGPASVKHYASHARALVWAPTLARPRNPRSSQGPPAA